MIPAACILSAASLAVVSAGTLNVPFQSSRTNTPRLDRHQALVKRMSELPLENLLVYYEATLQIGTPPQNLTFTIDTGSSDLWVMDSSNSMCATSESDLQNGYINCTTVGGIFNSNSSSTFEASESVDFSIAYGDNTYAYGYYATDTVKIVDATLDNAIFAVATDTNSSMAVFGVGPIGSEASITNYNTTDGEPIGSYSNIPAILKQQGTTDSAAYSLWLNDVNAADGQILFGGVDHAKYVGTLQLVPMVSGYVATNVDDATVVAEFQPYLPFVMLHGIYGYNREGGVGKIAEMSLPALLDSGTSLSYLPSDVVEAIASSIGAQYSSDAGGYVTGCDLEGGLALDFSGATITLPYSEFLYPLSAVDGSAITTHSGQSVCLLPIVASDVIILGDVVLRSMYCAYDSDKFQVAIANSRFNTTDTDVEPISNGIPRASTAASYSSTLALSSYSVGVLGSANYTTTLGLVTASNVGSATAGRSAVDTDDAVSGFSFSGQLVPTALVGPTGHESSKSQQLQSSKTTSSHSSSQTASNKASSSASVEAGSSSSSQSSNGALAAGVEGMLFLPLALLLVA